MKQTYRVTLEVTVDPDEIVEGLRNNEPSRWWWERILRNSDISVEGAEVLDCFVACCSNKVEWHNDQSEWEFSPDDHNEDCVNYVSWEVLVAQQEAEEDLVAL